MPYNILYAWELGDNLGHVGPFLSVARKLRQAGHTVTIALPARSSAAELLDAEHIPYVIVPRHKDESRIASGLNYADILSRFGFAHHASLLEQTHKWRELMQKVKPHITLIDHAPTAILAARTLNLKTMFFTTGFSVPPPEFPTPSLQPWRAISRQQLIAAEHPVVATINSVLTHFAQAPIKGVGQLFDIMDNTLLGLAELDHYPQRPAVNYWGMLPDIGNGLAPNWPKISGKRIFAYLRTDNPQFESICAALRSCDHPTVVFCPDGQKSELVRAPAQHITVTDRPVNLTAAIQMADIAITYGNFWTSTSFLLAGKPLLILPVYSEQYMLAKRLEHHGAAAVVKPDATKADVQSQLERLLVDPSYTESAQCFRRDHANHNAEKTVEDIVHHIEAVAAG